MRKLNYITAVWDNLEESYQGYSRTCVTDRKQYLRHLINFGKTSAGSAVLEDYLSDEVESYTAEEYEIYERLLKMFDEVLDKLNASDKNVESFEAFMNDEVVRFQLSNYTILKPRNLVTPELALQNGFLLDTVAYTGGTVVSYAIQENESYKVLYTANDLSEFLYQVDELNDFDKALYAALLTLAKESKITTPLIAMSPSYFNVKGKTFEAGSIKHSCTMFQKGVTAFKTLKGSAYTVNSDFVTYRIKIAGKNCTVLGIYNVS